MGSKLGLRGSTAQSLAAFKQRNDVARRKVQVLSEQPQTVDFAQYRSLLKNQDIVNDLEKHFTSFQPKKYDVQRQVKAIEAFEAQAIKSAEETKGKVDAELQDLEKTLKNIESARPFEDLTVVCTDKQCKRNAHWYQTSRDEYRLISEQDEVVAARPDIDKRVEQLVSKGRWQVPGYQVSREKYKQVVTRASTDPCYRRSSATSLCYKRLQQLPLFHRVTVYMSTELSRESSLQLALSASMTRRS